MTWWQRVRGRGRLEDELDAELRFHFDRLVADSIADGLSEEEARRRARAEFGGVETIKDACREARGTRWVHDLAQDVRFSARLLLKERRVTLVAVLALALGIGVNNTLFTVVNAICLRGPARCRPPTASSTSPLATTRAAACRCRCREFDDAPNVAAGRSRQRGRVFQPAGGPARRSARRRAGDRRLCLDRPPSRRSARSRCSGVTFAPEESRAGHAAVAILADGRLARPVRRRPRRDRQSRADQRPARLGRRRDARRIQVSRQRRTSGGRSPHWRRRPMRDS